jgi:hypothetical protein
MYCAESSETRVPVSRPRPRLPKSKSQHRDRDYESYILSGKTETLNLTVSVTRPRLRILVSRSRLRSDLIRWKQDSTGNPYNKLTVNLQDPKNKRCRDRDFSRPEIFRVVETKQKLSRLSKSYRDREFIESLANHWYCVCILYVWSHKTQNVDRKNQNSILTIDFDFTKEIQKLYKGK